MILYFLIGIPLAAGGMAYAFPSNHYRPFLLPLAGAAHLACVVAALGQPPIEAAQGWFLLDPVGKLVLLVVSTVFFFCFLYAPAYLRLREERSNRIFTMCLLLLLSALSMVCFSRQLGVMWVAIEVTSLVSSPLIYFNHNERSIEATWKYLLICSVGIALALLGSFFMGYSSLVGGVPSNLMMDGLVASAQSLSKPWLHAAFVTLLVGYGTKMGLAPLHTWKPDAYGESPGLVGALLAGGVTSCAFLAILRFTKIVHAAGDGLFADRTLVAFGLFSMAMGAVFMARQKDFKRMLAYSSVEHMGILVLGIGLGGVGIFGSFLHLLNNALTKGVLFLTSGNIHRAYKSKSTDAVAGAIRRLPISGSLFLAGFIAVTGSPPFGPFVSEFTILRASLEANRFGVGALYLGLLMIVFMGMGSTVLKVCQGEPSPAAKATDYQDSFLFVVPSLILMGALLWIGINIPQPLLDLVQQAANDWVGGVL